MKIKSFIVVLILISVSFTVGAYASSTLEKVEAFVRKDFQVFFQGKKVDMGAVLVYNGESYLPVSKVSGLLGADTRWNSENKGIYINPRFPGQPSQFDDGNMKYDSVTMIQPLTYKAKYLGGEYQVMGITAVDNKKYYRDRDIQRMGIDTRALRRAEEKHTKELYITEAEMALAWREKVTFTATYGQQVFGETTEEKLKVLKNFVDGIPATQKALNSHNPNYFYYGIPNVITIDVLPDNEFKILTYEMNRFKQYWVKLKKNHMDKWYQADYTMVELEIGLYY